MLAAQEHKFLNDLHQRLNQFFSLKHLISFAVFSVLLCILCLQINSVIKFHNHTATTNFPPSIKELNENKLLLKTKRMLLAQLELEYESLNSTESFTREEIIHRLQNLNDSLENYLRLSRYLEQLSKDDQRVRDLYKFLLLLL
ncbi:unnamed protein product [Clavelina lepadiformis]|uniref:Uncharacterized protein n=1 Tax=Clavelina lepadiformis TaxID=159417 RepID=A0ABP0GLE0_CLALP